MPAAPVTAEGPREEAAVAKYPDSTKTSLEQRLRARARERWPQIASLQIRHRGAFSYVDATLTDATTLKLCRLRYVGSAHDWQFAIYRASHDDYDESVFPTGLPVGTCQDALDTACGLYLNDPTAWIQPPTNLRARPLRFRCGYPDPFSQSVTSDLPLPAVHMSPEELQVVHPCGSQWPVTITAWSSAATIDSCAYYAGIRRRGRSAGTRRAS